MYDENNEARARVIAERIFMCFTVYQTREDEISRLAQHLIRCYNVEELCTVHIRFGMYRCFIVIIPITSDIP